MRKLFNTYPRITLIAFMLFHSLMAVAQEPAASADVITELNFMPWIIWSIVGFIVLILFFMNYTMIVMINHFRAAANKEPLFAEWMHKLTGIKPIEQEAVLLTDHEYDGIRELDNDLPPWWKYMFYATIVFGCMYLYYYHFNGNSKLQIQEYEQEMITAEIEKEEYMKFAANSIDESNVKYSNAKGIEKGKATFLQNCSACHGKLGEGGVGPNLTDDYWLHGGGLTNVFKTVKYGVQQKGMISWKGQLSPLSMQEVSSYIISIKGTNPPNAKAPQGDLYEEKVLVSK